MKTRIITLLIPAVAMMALFSCSNIDVGDAAPKVVLVIPADGSDSIEVGTGIDIHFDQGMDTFSCMQNFALFRGNYSEYQDGKLEGHYGWADNDTRMMFFPDDSLEHDREYTICLRSGMMGQGGHGMMMGGSHMDDDLFYHFRTR